MGSKKRRSILALLALCLALCLLGTACDDKAAASSMKLMRSEGTLRIRDDEGKSLSPLENMQLYSGYELKTARLSYAWIDLDDVKLAKMDASSEIEVRKDGRKLEIFVTSGGLFFNITEPLEEDETLNIRTSSMMVGIRGTCGWVEAPDEAHLRVYILEGTVECTVSDPDSGREEETGVSGGETAVLYLSPAGEIEIEVERFTEEDVPVYVRRELDDALREKIEEETGLHIPGGPLDGGGPASLVSQAAEELNGTGPAGGDLLGEQLDAARAAGLLQTDTEGGYEGTLLTSEDDLLGQLLGEEAEDAPRWQQELAGTLASGAGGYGSDSQLADAMQIRMGVGINCYKPNIYLYGPEGTALTVAFLEPELLTRTLPAYADSWTVLLGREGELTVDGQPGYGYLFYESLTIPGIFQKDEGFFIGTGDRAGQFAEILTAYGLNEQEIRDFVAFWDVMLDKEKAYVMYPQTTELVDGAMPIAVSGSPVDHYFRLWFCFREVEDGAQPELTSPVIVPASHEGTALVEWGGMILP